MSWETFLDSQCSCDHSESTHPAQQRDLHSLFIVIEEQTFPLWQACLIMASSRMIRELLPSKLQRGVIYTQSCSRRPVDQRPLQLRSRHVNHHRNCEC